MGVATGAEADEKELKELFPLSFGAPVARIVNRDNPHSGRKRKIGVILSGGQAPGGHNVISGLFDAMTSDNPESSLLGFEGGPAGMMEDRTLEITPELMNRYRNSGGFDIIGSGRNRLESEEQFQRSLTTCRRHGIDSVVISGGDDSNTNAAVLAEWFRAQKAGICVVGCPKTIDGDLKNRYIQTSFGFDTAAKTYSELIGNIARDANSARKYWHFIRLMGRSASHIALECALQTRPNICIISEEVRQRGMSLKDVVEQIAAVVVERSRRNWDYGLALVPEGLIEFIPEVGAMIGDLNNLLTRDKDYFEGLDNLTERREWVNRQLERDSSLVFSSLPETIQNQLLDDRDPHGNVQVSRIETEKLLMELVGRRLEQMRLKGEYSGKFSTLSHFFGYEGRCAFPSNFDSDYCYGLGFSAFLLLSFGMSGYIASLCGLHRPVEEWVPMGVPLTMMMNMEMRHGERRPVIRKALVDMGGGPFREFSRRRSEWVLSNDFRYPGAIQYYGPPELCDQGTLTLGLELS